MNKFTTIKISKKHWKILYLKKIQDNFETIDDVIGEILKNEN